MPSTASIVPAVVIIQNSETEGANYLGYFRNVIPSLPTNLHIVHYKMFNNSHLELLPQTMESLAGVHYCKASDDATVPPIVVQPCESSSSSVAESSDDTSPPKPFRIVGVMSFGGPMAAYENDKHPFINNVCTLISVVVEANMPYFGICLGAQMLAKALGGDCMKASIGEFGFIAQTVDEEASYATDLTAEAAKAAGIFDWFGGRKQLTTYQAHFDTFTIPKGCVRIASGPYCANQAFQIPHQYIMGVQWHPDLDRPKADTWLGLAVKFMNATDETMMPPGEYNYGNLIKMVNEGLLMKETNALADATWKKWFEGVEIYYSKLQQGSGTMQSLHHCSSATDFVSIDTLSIAGALTSDGDALSPQSLMPVGCEDAVTFSNGSVGPFTCTDVQSSSSVVAKGETVDNSHHDAVVAI